MITKLKKLYRIVIKRDLLGPFSLSKFGYIGKDVYFFKPYIVDRNKKSIYVGNGTTILADARIQLFPQLTRKKCSIRIGKNCYLGYRLTLLAGEDIIIEDGVLIASDVLVSSESHSMNPNEELYYMDQPLTSKPVVIKEGCWIGEKVCILQGVTIGRKSIIGAGSVVTKSIPDYCIAVGAPARVIKKFDFSTNEWIKCDMEMNE